MYDNVNELYTAVQVAVDSKEQNLVNNIPNWVFLAESELDRRLRHPAAEKVQIFTVQATYDYLTAPRNLLEIKSIYNRSSKKMLFRQSYENIKNIANYTNEPIGFASLSNMFILDKEVTKDTEFQVVYYTAPDKLGVVNSSNLYLTALPDFLYYVTLEHAFIFNGQPDQASYWRNMAERTFAMLSEQILSEEYQGSTLVSWQDDDQISRYY